MSATKTILDSYRDDMSAEEVLDFLDMMFGEDWDLDEEPKPEDRDEDCIIEHVDPCNTPSKYFIIKGGTDLARFKAWFSPQNIKIKGDVMFTLKHDDTSLLVMAETYKSGWFSFSSTTKIAKIILKILERTDEIKAFLEL